jgi:predicted anti-sigma-YlaC factor YlaD
MPSVLRLINQNCQCAARLISDETERELTRLERTGLSIHLAGCGTCRRYRRQVTALDALISGAADATSKDRLPESARVRISQSLAANSTDHIV